MSGTNVGAPGTAAGVAGQAPGESTENTAIVPTPDDERKDPFESLRAMAALKGHREHRLDGAGGYIIIGPMGWTSRELRDVHSLAQALRQMGVRV